MRFDEYIARKRNVVLLISRFDPSSLSAQFVPYFNSGARIEVTTCGMRLRGRIRNAVEYRLASLFPAHAPPPRPGFLLDSLLFRLLVQLRLGGPMKRTTANEHDEQDNVCQLCGDHLPCSCDPLANLRCVHCDDTATEVGPEGPTCGDCRPDHD